MSDEYDSKYRAKPITLYVPLGGVSNIDTLHYGKDITYIVDVELTEHDAIQLIDMLKNKLIGAENQKVFGSVTFRLKGRLVL